MNPALLEGVPFNVYKDETGVKSASVTKNGNVWTWQSDASRIDYDTQSGKAFESFAGGSADITGLSQDETGNNYYQELTYTTVSAEGYSLKEESLNGRLKKWGYYYNDTALLEAESTNAEGWINTSDWLKNSEVTIPAPVIIEFPDEEPAPAPSFSPIFNFKIFEGKIAEASVIQTTGSGTAASDQRIDKELFVLVNGIGNENEALSPEYMDNLRRDLFEQSNHAINPVKDVVISPAFMLSGVIEKFLVSVFGETVAREFLQKAKNVWDLFHAQQTAGDDGIVWDVRSGIKRNAEAQGINPYVRSLVGVGYSGGFAPLVAAVTNGEFLPKAFVALGGATFGIGFEMAKRLIPVVKAFEGVITVRDDASRAIAMVAVNALDLFLKGHMKIAASAADFLISKLNSYYDSIDSQNFDALMAAFYEDLKQELQTTLGFNWNQLQASNAELVVNVWGSEDELAIGNVLVGHLSEIGGYSVGSQQKPLFNVKIMGADHMDYIDGVGDYSNDPEKRDWNDLVARFVAKLISESKSKDTLNSFLINKGFAKDAQGTWIVQEWQVVQG